MAPFGGGPRGERAPSVQPYSLIRAQSPTEVTPTNIRSPSYSSHASYAGAANSSTPVIRSSSRAPMRRSTSSG